MVRVNWGWNSLFVILFYIGSLCCTHQEILTYPNLCVLCKSLASEILSWFFQNICSDIRWKTLCVRPSPAIALRHFVGASAVSLNRVFDNDYLVMQNWKCSNASYFWYLINQVFFSFKKALNHYRSPYHLRLNCLVLIQAGMELSFTRPWTSRRLSILVDSEEILASDKRTNEQTNKQTPPFTKATLWGLCMSYIVGWPKKPTM